MTPVTVKGQTSVFAKPPNWIEEADGICKPLPVRVEQPQPPARHATLVSAWKPSAEDLAVLNSGGVIELSCVGVQPPVWLEAVEGN